MVKLFAINGWEWEMSPAGNDNNNLISDVFIIKIDTGCIRRGGSWWILLTESRLLSHSTGIKTAAGRRKSGARCHQTSPPSHNMSEHDWSSIILSCCTLNITVKMTLGLSGCQLRMSFIVLDIVDLLIFNGLKSLKIKQLY